jgi:hypothetical protein
MAKDIGLTVEELVGRRQQRAPAVAANGEPNATVMSATFQSHAPAEITLWSADR